MRRLGFRLLDKTGRYATMTTLGMRNLLYVIFLWAWIYYVFLSPLTEEAHEMVRLSVANDNITLKR